MERRRFVLPLVLLFAVVFAWLSGSRSVQGDPAVEAKKQPLNFDGTISRHSSQMIEEGRKIFRFDTFGSEAFWGDTLGLHKAIAGEKLGGVGNGASPKTALTLGLKVSS